MPNKGLSGGVIYGPFYMKNIAVNLDNLMKFGYKGSFNSSRNRVWEFTLVPRGTDLIFHPNGH